MSYSFILRAADPAQARTLIAARLDKVVEDHPEQALVRDHAVALASTLLDQLGDVDPEMNIVVSMHGSVGAPGGTPDSIGVGMGVSVEIADPL